MGRIGGVARSAAYAGGVVFQRLLRAGEGKLLRRLSRIADAVESHAEYIGALTDAELRAKTDEFKERYADGESLDALLPEDWRSEGLRPGVDKQEKVNHG